MPRKLGQSVKVTFVDLNGNACVEYYNSFNKAAMRFDVYPKLIKNMIEQGNECLSTKTRKKFPDQIKIEYSDKREKPHIVTYQEEQGRKIDPELLSLMTFFKEHPPPVSLGDIWTKLNSQSKVSLKST